jgi:WD40 repeat protein
VLRVANRMLATACLAWAALPGWAGHLAHSEPLGLSAPLADCFGDPLPPDCLARMGTARFRLGGEIGALAFSPDGSILASSYGYLWDVASGRLLRALHCGRSLAYSPNGKLLAGMKEDNTIRVWEVSTGKERFRFPGPEGSSWGHNLAFSPDGKLLASGTLEGLIYLLEVENGRERLRLRGHEGPVFDVLFSPDGKLLISSGKDQAIRLWDVVSGRDLGELAWHYGSMSLSPDGKQLALLAWRSGEIRIWDMNQKRKSDPVGIVNGLKEVVFSPDGGQVLTCGREEVRLWDVAERREVFAARKSCRGLLCAAFSPDGKRIATGGSDGRIRFWETATHREIGPAEEHLHEGPVLSVAVAPDGKVVASGSADETVRLWDLPSGRERRAWNPGHFKVRAVAFWLSHKLLVTGGDRDPLRFWDPQTGKEERPWPAREGSYRFETVETLAFSAKGKKLLVSKQGVYLVDAATGLLQRAIAHFAAAGTPALSPDGRFIATRNVPKVTRVVLPPALARRMCGEVIVNPEQPFALWDAATGTRLRWLDGPKEIAPEPLFAFSPDGQMLAWGGWEEGILWDTTTWMEHSRFSLPGSRGVQAMTFSPDSRMLLTGCGDGSVCLWEAATAQERCRFNGHLGAVRGVAFTPDGRFAVTGSDDTTLLVWKVRGQGLGTESRPTVLSPEEGSSLWKQMGSADAATAYRAMKALARASERAPALLQEHIRTAFDCDRSQLDRWIADLDSEEPARREAGQAKLREAGDRAEAALRARLGGKDIVSPEQRRRIESLLSALEKQGASAAGLQLLRAVEVLEWIDTPASRQALKAMAQDAPGRWLQREARFALTRMSTRQE